MASFKDIKNKILNPNSPIKELPKTELPTQAESDNKFELEEARYLLNLIANSDFKGKDIQILYNIAIKLQDIIIKTTNE